MQGFESRNNQLQSKEEKLQKLRLSTAMKPKDRLSSNEIMSSERRPVFSKQKATSINQDLIANEDLHIRLRESGDLNEDSQNVELDQTET